MRDPLKPSTRQGRQLQRLGRAGLKSLLDIVENGIPVYDKNGQPVVGDDGKQLRKPAAPGYFTSMNRILDRHGVRLLTDDDIHRLQMEQYQQAIRDRDAKAQPLREQAADITARIAAYASTKQ